MILKHMRRCAGRAMTMPGAQGCGDADVVWAGGGCPNFAMRKFTVKAGGETPRHRHDYEHEVYILAGEGVAFGNGKENAIRAGDALYVPANEVHRFGTRGGRVGVCMHGAGVCASDGGAAAGGGG